MEMNTPRAGPTAPRRCAGVTPEDGGTGIPMTSSRSIVYPRTAVDASWLHRCGIGYDLEKTSNYAKSRNYVRHDPGLETIGKAQAIRDAVQEVRSLVSKRPSSGDAAAVFHPAQELAERKFSQAKRDKSIPGKLAWGVVRWAGRKD